MNLARPTWIPALAGLAIALAAAIAQDAWAAPRGHFADGPRHGPVRTAPVHLVRPGGPRIGLSVKVLPAGFVPLRVGPARFFYHTGWFYRRSGASYVVVSAPVGAVVHALPPGYTTTTLGSARYYVANGTYYAWDPARRGYLVTAAPAAITEATASAVTEVYVYPSEGQDEEQAALDRFECHRWAVTQSGFDPSAGNPAPDTAAAASYRRAENACLTGRGYSVR